MCKVVILNVLLLIKSSFGGYYDSDKLFRLNSSLQTNLQLYFSKNIMYFVHTWSNKTFVIVIITVTSTFLNMFLTGVQSTN